MELSELKDLVPGFPPAPEHGVERDAAIQHIVGQFSERCREQILVGEAMSGKTTLMSQFARAFSNQCVCYFITSSPLTQHLHTFLYTVVAQICTILGRDLPSDSCTVEDLTTQVVPLCTALAQKARRTGLVYYLLVDGIEWGLTGTEGNRIIDVCPLPTFAESPYMLYTCCSGREHDLPERLRSPKVLRSVSSLWAFNRDETRVFLSGIGLPVTQIDDLHRLCQGMPGYLSAVRRACACEGSFDISRAPSELEQLVQHNVSSALSGVGPAVCEALYLLAVAPVPLKSSSLARIVGADSEGLNGALQATGLVKPLSFDDRIEYSSEIVRDAVLEIAGDELPRLLDVLLTYFTRSEPDEELLLDLLLMRRHDYEALERRLAASAVLAAANDSRLGVPMLLRRLHGACELALESGLPFDLVKWCLAVAAVRAFTAHAANEREIDARIAIGDTSEALHKANALTEVTARISALARVFSGMMRSNLSVPSEAKETLIALVTSLDVQTLDRDLARRMAIDLLPVLPDLALDLLDKVTAAGEEESVIDKAVNLLRNTGNSASDEGDQQEPGLGEQRRDERLEEEWLSSAPLGAVLRLVAHVRSPRAREYLLRAWCRNNPTSEAFESAVDAWLEVSLAQGVPLRSVRQITDVLCVQPADVRKRLINKLRVPEILSIRSPVEEWVSVRLDLADAGVDHAPDDASETVREVYREVCAVPELDARLFCLARILLSASRNGRIDATSVASIREQFEVEFYGFLANSAEHFHALTDTLALCSRLDPQQAILMASYLNTSVRRARAARLVLAEALRWHGGEDLSLCIDLAVHLMREAGRDDLLTSLLMNTRATHGPISPGNIMLLHDHVRLIVDHTYRSQALAALAAMSSTDSQPSCAQLLNEARDSWRQETDLSTRLNWGYELVVRMAGLHCLEQSGCLLRQIDEDLREPVSSLAVGALGAIYEAVVDAACRCVDLEAAGHDDTIDRLRAVGERIPGPVRRIRSIAVIAASVYRAGYRDRFDELVRQTILPALAALVDASDREAAVYCSLPVVFVYDQEQALKIAAGLNKSASSRAWYGAIMWCLCQSHLGDHLVEPSELRCTRDHPILRRIADVALPQVTTDSLLAAAIHAVSRVVAASCTQHLNPRQALDILERCARVAEDLFPDKDNIRHSGFLVLARGYVHSAKAALNRSLRGPNRDTSRGLSRDLIRKGWRQLEEAVKARPEGGTAVIPNAADRAFVAANLAKEMHSYYDEPDSSRTRSLLEEAASAVDTLPSLHDRIDRCMVVAKVLHSTGGDSWARTVIRKAADMTSQLRGASADRYLESAVEVAYRIDKDLADEIVLHHDPNRLPGALPTSAEWALRASEMVSNPSRLDRLEGPVEFRAAVMRKSVSRMLREAASGIGVQRDVGTVMSWLMQATALGSGCNIAVCLWALENLRAKAPEQSRVDVISGLLDLADIVYRLAGLANTRSFLSGSAEWDASCSELSISIKTFHVGQESVARTWVQNWISQNAKQYLKICDPYFGWEQLDYLRYVPAGCKVIVVTTDAYLSSTQDADELARLLKVRWEDLAGSADPPESLLYVVPRALEDRFHDRALITDQHGLSLGQSLNRLGASRGNILVLDDKQKRELEDTYVDGMLESATWFVNYGVRPLAIFLP